MSQPEEPTFDAADGEDDDAPLSDRGAPGEARDELLRARLLDALDVLREVQADRGLLAVLDEPTRRELMIAAGHSAAVPLQPT